MIAICYAIVSFMLIVYIVLDGRNFDRIVESLFGNVRLADESNRRHWSAFELPFHRGERDRLVMTNHLGLRVASWKRDEEGRD